MRSSRRSPPPGTNSALSSTESCQRLLDAQGFGPVLAVNPAGVVMGAACRDDLQSAPAAAEVGTVARFGVSTVRPSEDAAALAHRMSDQEVTRVVVTRPDGTLIGLFFGADVT